MRFYFICNSMLWHVFTLLGLLCPFELDKKSVEHFIVGTGVLTERPVIGVLTRPDKRRLHGDEFLDGVYVRNLEMAGAQVVPILPKKDLQYYERIVNSVNGIYLPGGAAGHNNSTYRNTSQILFDLAVEANIKGDYFPIWGTCLGSQILIKVVSRPFRLKETWTKNITLPSKLPPGHEKSRLFRHIPHHLLTYLRDKNFSMHNHRYSAGLADFEKNHAVRNFFRVLSTHVYKQHEFVGTFEAFDYPFYGTVWHPERSIFGRPVDKLLIDYSYDAIQLGRYFVDFFVGEARKNSHRFEPNIEKGLALIGNFERFCEPDSTFGERYYFNYTDDSK